MKFWQKLFLAVLALFLLGGTALLAGFLVESNKLQRQLVVQSAQTEMSTLQNTVTEKLSRVAGQHTHFTTQALRMHLHAQSELYRESASFFQMDAGGGQTYSSLESGWMEVPPMQDGAAFFALDHRLYYAQAQTLHVEDNALQLVLLKDVSALIRYQRQLVLYSIAIYAAVSLLLAGILLALVLRLTKPLRRLTRTTERMAQGQLSQRAEVHGRDEIGAFAASFNHMADAVQRQMTALEESNAQRQWFIDSLSHELRTPVTAIVGYGELLQYAAMQPQEREKAIAYIIEQGNRLHGLSEKLLELARLQHGQIALVCMDLRCVAERAVQSVALLAKQRGIRITCDLLETPVYGDAALLETLALNLLENAVHASSDGQEVLIRVWQGDGGACLAVRDHGIGISPEAQGRITEAFYRVDPSRSRKNGGVGLGLTLCKQICLLHRATLSIASAPGAGCAVTVTFYDSATTST